MAVSDRAFVLGLDGVPWRLVERWAGAGQLPHFETIIEEGAAGVLESTTPAATPLAWPSIVTGTWPDQHGIYSFQRVTPEYTHDMQTQADISCPQLWDILSPAVVGNVPMTYPAAEIDGKMVAGMMAPEIDQQYTHPPALATRIETQLPDYEISLDWATYSDDQTQLVDDVSSLLSARRELMRWLMDTEEWQLFFFTYTEPDRLQHLVWDLEVLRDHYQQLDTILGEVMDYVERRNATLFVVSDHGFGPISKRIAPNATLARESYLTPSQAGGTQGLLETVGITKSRVRTLLDSVGLDEEVIVKQYLPRRLVDRLAATVPGDHSLYDLNHAETQAFAHEFGNVYINDTDRFREGCVDPANVQQVKDELRSVFDSLTDPSTGEEVLAVHDGAELFPRDPSAPDLVLEPDPGYGVSFSLAEEPFTTPSAAADHETDGIFLAWGPEIAAGSQPQDASVVDVAPTVIHSCGQPIPAATDGRVLTEIYADGAEPAQRPVATAEYGTVDHDTTVTDDMEAVEERLQGLGYME